MKTYEESRRGDVLRDPESGVYFPKDIDHPRYKRFLEERAAGKARVRAFSEGDAASIERAARMRALKASGITQADAIDALLQAALHSDNRGLDRIREALQ